MTLDVEPEFHDVAVDHDVILALESHLSTRLRLGHGTRVDEVVEGDHFRSDEATLEIGVDLARVYALDAGVDVINTRERLEAAVSSGELSQSGARDLGDALAFLSDTRFRHQTRQLEAGLEADNLVAPDSLSRFERGHLKDAFAIVRTMQRSLAQRFGR